MSQTFASTAPDGEGEVEAPGEDETDVVAASEAAERDHVMVPVDAVAAGQTEDGVALTHSPERLPTPAGGGNYQDPRLRSRR